MQGALTEHVKAAIGIKADAHAAGTITGTGVDTTGFSELMVVVNAGTFAATATVDITLEESDASGSGYAAISGAAFTQLTTSNDDNIYVARVRLGGRDKYVRAVAVVANAAADFAVDFLLGEPYKVPVSQINSVVFSLTA